MTIKKPTKKPYHIKTPYLYPNDIFIETTKPWMLDQGEIEEFAGEILCYEAHKIHFECSELYDPNEVKNYLENRFQSMSKYPEESQPQSGKLKLLSPAQIKALLVKIAAGLPIGVPEEELSRYKENLEKSLRK